MQSRLGSRGLLIVLALIILFAVGGCAPPSRRELFCTRGNRSKGAPMICVSNDTLRPDPFVASVWDFQALQGVRTERPVTVHWFAQRTAEMSIEFKPAPNGKDCLRREPVCQNGHCTAEVAPLDQGEKVRNCKYSITIDGRTLDPELAVNPCCW
jgi:hypothetical protein